MTNSHDMNDPLSLIGTQEQMRPGVISSEGFVAPDTRDLQMIIDEDAEAVKKLGVSVTSIADAMKDVLSRARAALESPIRIGQDIEACMNDARGSVPCPYSHPGLFRKGAVAVRDLSGGVELSWSELSVHLVREHGFFGGKGNHFRVDPETLVRILGVKREQEF